MVMFWVANYYLIFAPFIVDLSLMNFDVGQRFIWPNEVSQGEESVDPYVYDPVKGSVSI